MRGGAATSKEAHSEGSERVGRRKESPDCWAAGPRAAAGRLPSQCLQTWPRLLFASFPFHFPSSSSRLQARKNLRAKTHHNLIPHRDQGHPAETRGRTNSHPCPHTCPSLQPEKAGGKPASGVKTHLATDSFPSRWGSPEPNTNQQGDLSSKTHTPPQYLLKLQIFLLAAVGTNRN